MKPILFSTQMVEEILYGRKSVTRRVIKPQPDLSKMRFNGEKWEMYLGYPMGHDTPRCPYGNAGDILWVRETWGQDGDGNYVYRTNYGTTEDDSFPPSMFKWKPSIYMPKAAARIFLRIVDVRVERVQEITEEQAVLEGARAYGPNNCSGTSARIAFAELWDSLNAKRGYGWDINPWVWVIEFERVERE